MLGGFGASFMVRNHTYVNYNGKKEFMGEAEDIRTFNISTNIGFGVEYPPSEINPPKSRTGIQILFTVFEQERGN